MTETQSAGHHTRREIMSQPEVWAAALDELDTHVDSLAALFHRHDYGAVYFTGCGSTYYLSLAAAAVFQQLTGIPAAGLPASELWHAPSALSRRLAPALLIAVSRSGETTETVRACERFRAEGRGHVMTLGCYPGRSLESQGDINLLFPSAQEESVAQTRAFSTLYLATTALALIAGGHRAQLAELARLPAVAQRLLSTYGDTAAAIGRDPAIDRFYFLGSGPVYGLACELSLKMKEMSLSHSEPFHAMEFRHGPRAMATAGACAVGLISGDRASQEHAVLEEVRSQGGRTFSLGDAGTDVAFASEVAAPLRNVLYLPVGQLVGLERALAKGLNPDRPENLVAYVTLQ
ncbi:MAG: SIS domain-containing protein [Caldilineaceae bacterium]|nr:SIS domain-containing protein [Caldilineaceae bacterium]